MNRRSFGIITTASALTLGACAVVERVTDVPGHVVNRLGEMGSAVAEERKCAELGKAQVSWEEEKPLGDAVILNLAKENGGLEVTVPKALEARLRSEPLLNPPTRAVEGKSGAATESLAIVGKNLAFQSHRPNIPWTFAILNSQKQVALSAPGGWVLISSGMLDKVENEAQLAGVIAHEIGHVTLKHSLEAYKDNKVHLCNVSVVEKTAQAGGGLVTDVVPEVREVSKPVMSAALEAKGFINWAAPGAWKVLGELGEKTAEKLMSSGLSRNQELEADRMAADLMISAGYDPMQLVALLEKLPDDASHPFAQHPSNADRVKELREYLGKKPKLSDTEFVEGANPGTNKVPPLAPELHARR